MKRKGNSIRKMRKFSEEKMKEAVLKVAEYGLPVHRVSKEDGLCKNTLKSYVDRYLSCAEERKTDICFKPNYEINQVFTNDLEKIFEDFLITVDRTQQKLSRDSLRSAAYEFATNCNVHVPKTWNIRKKAGMDWMYGFLNRHPRIKDIIISNKKMKSKVNDEIFETNESDIEEVNVFENEESMEFDIENIKIEEEEEIGTGSSSENDLEDDGKTKLGLSNSIKNIKDDYFYTYLKTHSSRISNQFEDDNYWSAVSVKTPMDEFEENLNQAYKAIARDNCVPSEHVYNLDEIALVVENPSHVSSKKVVVTACCFINAAGVSLPPFMVFPRKRFKKSMLTGLPKGVSAMAMKSGLVDDDVFEHVLQHFQDAVKASPQKKIILILDDDDFHVTINSLDFCHKHGIELVTIPPHNAKKLSPIGKHVFKTLKTYFNKACNVFRFKHPDVNVSMYDVNSLFCSIYPHAFTEDKIMAGFQETGIYPLVEEIFKKDSSIVTDSDGASEDSLECTIELVPTGIEDSGDEESSDEETVNYTYQIRNPISCAPLNIPGFIHFDKTLTEEYFDNLVQAYNEINNYGGISAERVYNMDEIELVLHTPLNTNPKIKSIVTVCCYVNAAGNTIPPFLVYPEDNFKNSILEDEIEGMKGIVLESNMEYSDIFLLMLQHFHEKVNSLPEDRVMLIIDTDHSHITLKSLDFVQEHGIILVTVPPHISKPLQPLEKTVFKNLITNFRKECDHYVFSKEGQNITVCDIVRILKKVYSVSFSVKDIVDGFWSTGVWPLNQEFFERDELCSIYTERPHYLGENAENNSDNDSIFKGIKFDEMSNSDWDSDSLLSTNEIFDFFENLDAAFERLQRTNDLWPSHIYVVGELMLTIPEDLDFIGTACCFVNAVGHSLSPFIILSHQFDVSALQDMPPGTVAIVKNDEIVREEMFLKILQHFQNQVKMARNEQVLLITDNEQMQENEKVSKFCQDCGNGIILQSTQVYLSKKFHPLRRSIFDSITNGIIHECEKLKQKNFTRHCTVTDVIIAFGRVYPMVFTQKRITEEFKKCDIWPRKGDDIDMSEQFSSSETDTENELLTSPASQSTTQNSKRSTALNANDDEIVTSTTVPDTVMKSGFINLQDSNFDAFIIEEEVELKLEETQAAESHDLSEKIYPPMFTCGECNIKYNASQELLEHIKIHQGKITKILCNEYRCRYCDLVFFNKKHRIEHEKKHMKGNMHICPICEKECGSKAALVQHRRKHIFR